MDPHEPAKPVMFPDDRPQSPFQRLVFEPNTQVDVSAWSVDRLIETTITGGAAEAAGALLASAIWHGALLDPDRWPGWLTNLPGCCDGASSWFNLPPTDGAGAARWFVDPMTRLLLDRWMERPGIVVDLPPAPLCLRAFLEPAGAKLQAFTKQAEWRWRLRLPAVLIEKAFGRMKDRSLPDEAWMRLLNALPVSVPHRPAKKRTQGAARSNIERLVSKENVNSIIKENTGFSSKQVRNHLVKKSQGMAAIDILDLFVLKSIRGETRKKNGKQYAISTICKYSSKLRLNVFNNEYKVSKSNEGRSSL